MQAIKHLIFWAIVAAIGLVAWAWSGHYDVAVGSGHARPTAWFLHTLRERSVERRAGDLQVPADLGDEARIAAGAGHYDAMCARCHGRPGRAPATRFEPAPPALAEHAEDPAEAFWVIRHGIKMSAMPRHDDHSDADIWDTVAFLQKLPELDEASYLAMAAAAEHGHDDGGHGEDGHAHEPPVQAAPGGSGTTAGAHAHEDGTAHDHGAEPAGAPGSLAADDPVAAIDAFHAALRSGDGDAALARLHPKATILEGGQIETRAEYAGHHLGADMAFSAGTRTERLAREQNVAGDQAVVRTRSRIHGQFNGRPVDMVMQELVTLHRGAQGWLITHIQWAPAAEGADP